MIRLVVIFRCLKSFDALRARVVSGRNHILTWRVERAIQRLQQCEHLRGVAAGAEHRHGVNGWYASWMRSSLVAESKADNTCEPTEHKAENGDDHQHKRKYQP